MRLVAVVDDEAIARRILLHLGAPRAHAAGSRRSPTSPGDPRNVGDRAPDDSAGDIMCCELDCRDRRDRPP
jgi:hypothetical protein